MGRLARQFGDFYRAVSGDIFKFCAALRFNPTRQQSQLLEAVQRGDRQIAVKSGQGPGKTATSVIVGLWRAMRDFNAEVIVTAPTMRQCKDVWLKEARSRVAEADKAIQQIIEVTKTKVSFFGMPDWGIKLVTTTKEVNAQGIHNPNLSIIVEEASGVPRSIITQYQGTLSNPNAFLLLIGNPNTRTCKFFDCFHTQRRLWTNLTWNAEDTAKWNPDIVSPERNRLLEEEFGRESDVYRVRVLGEFPHADPNCVVSSEDLLECASRSLLVPASQIPRHEKHGGGLARQFGIDLARFGGDESVVVQRSGNAAIEMKCYSHYEPSDVVSAAFAMQAGMGWSDRATLYVCDAGGMGQGVMHRFYDAGKRVFEFHNGGAAQDEQFANRVTEAWFHFARLAKARRCYIPHDLQLIQQLSERVYYTNAKGKIVLETKDEYLKRDHEASPDRADACVTAFYDEPSAPTMIAAAESSRPVGRVTR